MVDLPGRPIAEPENINAVSILSIIGPHSVSQEKILPRIHKITLRFFPQVIGRERPAAAPLPAVGVSPFLAAVQRLFLYLWRIQQQAEIDHIIPETPQHPVLGEHPVFHLSFGIVILKQDRADILLIFDLKPSEKLPGNLIPAPERTFFLHDDDCPVENENGTFPRFEPDPDGRDLIPALSHESSKRVEQIKSAPAVDRKIQLQQKRVESQFSRPFFRHLETDQLPRISLAFEDDGITLPLNIVIIIRETAVSGNLQQTRVVLDKTEPMGDAVFVEPERGPVIFDMQAGKVHILLVNEYSFGVSDRGPFIIGHDEPIVHETRKQYVDQRIMNVVGLDAAADHRKQQTHDTHDKASGTPGYAPAFSFFVRGIFFIHF
ncbi:MAG: hypothetical protein IJS14_11640 [Lentisphaeria bacterium]|nr:hypothetical protein [Lentisphaeria bacterium]